MLLFTQDTYIAIYFEWCCWRLMSKMIRKTLVKKVKIINLRKKNEWTKKKKIDNIKGVIKKKKTFISLSSICFLTAIWKEDEFNQGFFHIIYMYCKRFQSLKKNQSPKPYILRSTSKIVIIWNISFCLIRFYFSNFM